MAVRVLLTMCHATFDDLSERLRHILEGRLTCTAEIASAMMRALFRKEEPEPQIIEPTRRQNQVAHLLERGLSNKEMARVLDVSVGTVKHHVQDVLGRLGVNRRTQAMRIVRSAPWRF